MRPLYGRAVSLRPSISLASRVGGGAACLFDAASIVDGVSTVLADVSTTVSVDALGKDIFIFLAASVLVVPLSRFSNTNSVLGFLALGCAIGPYGLGLFSNSEADLQLGDFGIVFLLGAVCEIVK